MDDEHLQAFIDSMNAISDAIKAVNHTILEYTDLYSGPDMKDYPDD